MKKYNDEHFTVRERRTHKKICDCGSFEDAIMMMRMDTPNREIVRNKELMSPVVDIEMPKALPTTEIVVNKTDSNSGFGGSLEVVESMGFGKQLPQIKLPEGQGIPVNAK